MIRRLLQFWFPPKTVSRPLVTEGIHVDLKQVYERVNQTYFSGTLELQISWVGSARLKPRSSLRLGAYYPHLKLIKIHRLLDHPEVPLYFIESIVYHEMLHHQFPPKKARRGRRQIHHAEFKEQERRFARFEEARAYAKAFLHTRTSTS